MAGVNGLARPTLSTSYEALAGWLDTGLLSPRDLTDDLRGLGALLLAEAEDRDWMDRKDVLRMVLNQERPERAVAHLHGALRAQALMRHAEREGVGQEPPATPRFVLLTPAEVKSRPPPRFVVDDLLVANSLAELYGAPGSFKSFLALGIALDVSAPRPTLGRDVLGGPAVYVSAEGSAGMGQRIRAWEVHTGLAAPERCRFLLDQPQLLDRQQVEALRAVVAAMPQTPVLIAIDTLARVMVGGEENSNKDMGLVVAALDLLRADTGACVLLLHHPNRAGTNARGGGGLDGALDTQLEIKREGETAGVFCRKQKDAAEFAPIFLRRRVVDVAGEGRIGQTSVVLEPSEGGISALTLPAQQVAAALWETFGEDGASTSTWQRVCDKIPESTFYRCRLELLNGGYVSTANPGQRGARYRVTVKYLEASGEFVEEHRSQTVSGGRLVEAGR